MLILRIPGVIYLQNKYLNNASSDIKFGPRAMSDDVIFYLTTPWAGWQLSHTKLKVPKSSSALWQLP
jgi:hypothetical protein